MNVMTAAPPTASTATDDTDRSPFWGTNLMVIPIIVLSAARLTASVDVIVLTVATHLTIGVWLAANAWLRPDLRLGAILLNLGGTANLIAIWSNGGMPVGGARFHGTDEVLDARHITASDSVRFAVFGDWIELTALRMTVSPGDVLMLVGVVAIVFGVRRRKISQGMCINPAGAGSLGP